MRRWTAGLVMAGVLVTACTNGSGVESRGVEEVTVEVTVDPVTSDSPVDTIPTPDPTAETVPGTEMPVDTEVPPADGSWTVLVYSIADTDLEPYMMDDLDELGTVGGSGASTSSAWSTVPPTTARIPCSDSTTGRARSCSTSVMAVPRCCPISVTSTPATRSCSRTSSPPASRQYPAEHYALVISDHGASWPGVGGDESAGGNGLDLAELSRRDRRRSRGCRRGATRPPRLRCVPDGELRGRERDGAAGAPDARVAGARARARLGLHGLPAPRRGPGDRRRHPRRGVDRRVRAAGGDAGHRREDHPVARRPRPDGRPSTRR